MADIHALEIEFAKNPTLDACIPLCEAYLGQKRFMEAMVVCKKGIKSAPADARGPVMLARVYLDQGKGPKAEQELTQAATQFPNHPLVLEMTGRMFLEQGKRDDAVRVLTQALQANPNLANAQAMLGKLGVAAAAAAPVAPPVVAPAVAAAASAAAPAAARPATARPAAAPGRPAAAPPPVQAQAVAAGAPPPMRPAFTPAAGAAGPVAASAQPAWQPGLAPAAAGAPVVASAHGTGPEKALEHVSDFFAPDTLGFANDVSGIETAGPGRLTILGFVPKSSGSIKTTIMVALGVLAVAGGIISYQIVSANQTKEMARIMADVRAAISEDTYMRYKEATVQGEKALAVDDSNNLALSAMAFAYAVLAIEHGEDSIAKAKDYLARAERADEKEVGYRTAARAMIAFADRAFEQGLADLKKVIDKGGSDANVEAEAFRLMLVLKPADKDTQVQERRLAAIASSGVRAQNFLGWYYYMRNNWERADANFSGALQMNRNHPQALLGKSLVDLDRGIGLKERQKEVEANIKRVFAQGDDLSRSVLALSHFSRAQLLQWQGNTAEAEADFKKALELDPQNAMFDFRRGVALLSLSKPKEALESLKAAAAKSPNEARYFKRLAEAQSATGDYAGAKASLERAAQLAPTDFEVTLLEGARLRGSKEYDKAIEAYNAIKLEQGGDAYALAQLGVAAAYRESGRAAKGVQHMEEFLPKVPSSAGKETEARLWCELGLNHEAAKNREKALESFQVGIEQYRYYPDCHYFYCRALGSGNEANEACKAYLELAPNGEHVADAKKRVK